MIAGDPATIKPMKGMPVKPPIGGAIDTAKSNMPRTIETTDPII
jgi:hypothetical protein